MADDDYEGSFDEAAYNEWARADDIDFAGELMHPTEDAKPDPAEDYGYARAWEYIRVEMDSSGLSPGGWAVGIAGVCDGDIDHHDGMTPHRGTKEDCEVVAETFRVVFGDIIERELCRARSDHSRAVHAVLVEHLRAERSRWVEARDRAVIEHVILELEGVIKGMDELAKAEGRDG